MEARQGPARSAQLPEAMNIVTDASRVPLDVCGGDKLARTRLDASKNLTDATALAFRPAGGNVEQ
jgi:hypothetical protein